MSLNGLLLSDNRTQFVEPPTRQFASQLGEILFGIFGGIANHVAEHLQIENRLAALGEIRDKEPANRDRHRCRGVDERVSVFAAGR